MKTKPKQNEETLKQLKIALWTSRNDSLELIELSSINKVSLV